MVGTQVAGPRRVVRHGTLGERTSGCVNAKRVPAGMPIAVVGLRVAGRAGP